MIEDSFYKSNLNSEDHKKRHDAASKLWIEVKRLNYNKVFDRVKEKQYTNAIISESVSYFIEKTKVDNYFWPDKGAINYITGIIKNKIGDHFRLLKKYKKEEEILKSQNKNEVEYQNHIDVAQGYTHPLFMELIMTKFEECKEMLLANENPRYKQEDNAEEFGYKSKDVFKTTLKRCRDKIKTAIKTDESIMKELRKILSKIHDRR